jgi:hypothetical protein
MDRAVGRERHLRSRGEVPASRQQGGEDKFAGRGYYHIVHTKGERGGIRRERRRGGGFRPYWGNYGRIREESAGFR